MTIRKEVTLVYVYPFCTFVRYLECSHCTYEHADYDTVFSYSSSSSSSSPIHSILTTSTDIKSCIGYSDAHTLTTYPPIFFRTLSYCVAFSCGYIVESSKELWMYVDTTPFVCSRHLQGQFLRHLR